MKFSSEVGVSEVLGEQILVQECNIQELMKGEKNIHTANVKWVNGNPISLQLRLIE